MCCLLCRRPLSWSLHRHEPGSGVLRCSACAVRVPVLAGFPMFSERDLDRGAADEPWLDALSAALLGDPTDYERYLIERRRRGSTDRYAAFRPFNESSRTVLSFVPLLLERLEPGDLILDTWNRTGWTGELLAGLFPEQTVVSLWEGHCDNLGYRGFRHWFAAGDRPPNLEIAFVDLRRDPLPFHDGTFAFVHGLDTLHRYPIHTLLPELVRVSRPEAPILCPHVHLSNAEPDPFFERGGRQLHGRNWHDLLTHQLRGDPRQPVIVGERTLFATQRRCTGTRLDSCPHTDDYNAVVGIVPPSWVGGPLAPEPAVAPPADLKSTALIPNHLCPPDLGDGSIGIQDPDDLVCRHPVYAARLAEVLPDRLAPLARQVHYWASRLPTAGAIAQRLGLDLEAVRAAVAALADQELLRAQPLSQSGARLQRYHATLDDAPFADADDLPALWRRAVRLYGARPFLVDDTDGSTFTYQQADEVVQALARRLRTEGLSRGDRVVLWCELHVEAILFFWAAVHLGLVVVPLDPDLRGDAVGALCVTLKPKLLLVDLPRSRLARDAVRDIRQIVFDGHGDDDGDDDDDTDGALRFADWITDADFAPDAASLAHEPLATTPAMVLFTSGTTGEPRGVVLEQHALAHSGRLMAQTFGWTETDVYFGLGDLHVMSGFRNPCVATVHAGAATVVATAAVRRTPQAVVDAATRRGATILGTVPAAVRGLVAIADRVATRPTRLRLVLSTAAPLPEAVRSAFEAAYAIPVVAYYGLTETAGLCAAETRRTTGAVAIDGGIGQPVEALFRLVGADGVDVAPGATGELWIHSANLMCGYLGDPEATRAALVDGWFRTGDLARREADGSFRLVGRAKDVFKNAFGEIVAAAEVEAAIRAHAAVADAAVLVASTETGERLEAYVVAHGARPDTAAWLADLHRHLVTALGPKKVPTGLHPVDALPRNANGKVQAHILAASSHQ
ncbi:MAG: class I adenylate-forming enzyme family protein [Planctomycetota bacterium]